MTNKRGKPHNPEIVYKRWETSKIRSMYRAFGWDKIPIGRSQYKLTLCSHLYYADKPCDVITDTNEKRIYIVVHGIDYAQVQSKLFGQFMFASLHENGITQDPGWSRDLEDKVVDRLSYDFDRFFNIRVRKAFKPS